MKDSGGLCRPQPTMVTAPWWGQTQPTDSQTSPQAPPAEACPAGSSRERGLLQAPRGRTSSGADFGWYKASERKIVEHEQLGNTRSTVLRVTTHLQSLYKRSGYLTENTCSCNRDLFSKGLQPKGAAKEVSVSDPNSPFGFTTCQSTKIIKLKHVMKGSWAAGQNSSALQIAL